MAGWGFVSDVLALRLPSRGDEDMSALDMWSRRLSIAAFALFLAGCSNNKPSTADVAASLESLHPAYAFSDLECETFADRSREAAGRVSCRGTSALSEDLYSEVGNEAQAGMLVDAGVPELGGNFFLDRHPAKVYIGTGSVGIASPMNAECDYFRNIDGWQITCSSNHMQYGGSPRSALPADAVIQGSPEYQAYIARVMADYRRLDEYYRRIRNQVELFFSPGRTLTLFARGSPVMRMRVSSPVAWTGEPGYLGYPSLTLLELPVEGIGSNASNTLCGYGRGSPAQARLDVTIGPSTDQELLEHANHYTPEVSVLERTRLFSNEFRGCNTLRWNGQSFGGGRSHLELRSE